MRRIVVLLAVVLLAGCGQPRGMNPAGPASASPDSEPRAIAVGVVERTLAQAPLPSGTRSATAQEAAGKELQSHPADANLVDRHATYVVPLGYQQAIAWFKGHLPPRLEQAGTSTAGGLGGPIAAGVYFAGPATRAYDSLAEQVAIYPLDAKHAVVRVDGLAVWLPRRTAAERAPMDATAVHVVRVARAGATPQRFTLIGGVVQQLARTLNRQSTISNGPVSCPSDTGAYDVLRFTGTTPGPVFRIEASGCRLITVTTDGLAQPTLSGGTAVEQVLADRLPHPEVHPAGHVAFDPKAPACRPSQLKLVGLAPISAMTGEHGFTVQFRNSGRRSCNLTGYPNVSFSDASGRLPFRYQDGGGQYFNPLLPQAVTVPASNRPGVAFEIAKYRCDLGIARTATTLHFRLPGAVRSADIPLGAGYREDYCTGGPTDPGQLVYVNHPQAPGPSR